MSYFLEREQERKVRLVSVVDGKEVEAVGVMREVSAARHQSIYANIAKFQELQSQFADIDVLKDKAVRELTEGVLNEQQFREQLDKYARQIEELQAFLPAYYKETAETCIKFDGEAPSLEFYASDGFEYVRLIRVRDFFLNVQENLKSK